MKPYQSPVVEFFCFEEDIVRTSGSDPVGGDHEWYNSHWTSFY